MTSDRLTTSQGETRSAENHQEFFVRRMYTGADNGHAELVKSAVE